jgi:protein MpaA
VIGSVVGATNRTTDRGRFASRRRTLLVLVLTVAAVIGASAAVVDAVPVGQRCTFARSTQGRPLEVVRRGTPGGVRVMVVGVIHGDEDAGLQIVDELLTIDVPDGIDLWIVPTMNPDGTAEQVRGNANGVDLNRNFPYRWARMGKRGYWQFSGPRAASEVETREMVRFIRTVRPQLAIWYHQDLNLVAPGIGLEGMIRERYAQLTNLPMKTITGGTYTGIAATWQRNRVPESMAFVVELGPSLRNGDALMHARAVLAVAGMLRSARTPVSGETQCLAP